MPVQQMLKRINEAHRTKTAIHEAGHAVFAVYYGFYLINVNIVRNYKKHRQGAENHSVESKKDFEDAVVSYGGYTAVNVVFGMSDAEVEEELSSGDWAKAEKCFKRYCEQKKWKFDDHFDQLHQKAMDAAFNLMDKKGMKRAVLLVAEALLKKETLKHKEVEWILYKAGCIKKSNLLLVHRADGRAG
jgi:hypothetical protein